MGKRHLTSRQLSQLKALHAKRLARALSHQDLGPEQPGLLVAHYGTTLIVENQAGELFRCRVRQNLGTLVTGDQVIWQKIDDSNGVVIACQPRHSIIMRKERKVEKPLVANVDCIGIVLAVEPPPHKTTLDRYLIIAENLKIHPLIILNKCDLYANVAYSILHRNLLTYQNIGYPCFEVSSKTGDGLSMLTKALKDHTSVLVGQSGVGKTSLLRAFVPDAKVQIRELSKIHRQGRHTTTASCLYHLKTGGDLIDSPGIHQFDLLHFTKNEIIQGFIEFQPYLNQCKFRNCDHHKEPGCALQNAVSMGKIAPFRLQNYLLLISEITN